MMKKKSILAIGLTAALLFGLTGEAEAFGWGDIAGKAADKAIGSVLGSSAKKKPVKQSQPKSEKQKKSEREAEKYGVKRIESPDGSNPTAFAGTVDPWPPDELSARPDWFDNRTQPWIMTNARLVAEYESMIQWRAACLRETKWPWYHRAGRNPLHRAHGRNSCPRESDRKVL